MPATREQIYATLKQYGSKFRPEEIAALDAIYAGTATERDRAVWGAASQRVGPEQAKAYINLRDAWNGVERGNKDFEGDARLQQAFRQVDTYYQQELGDAAARDSEATLSRERNAVTNQLQRYFEMLNSPVMDAQGNYTDPLAKQLVATGVNTGQQEAARRGIGGPMGSAAAATSANTALQPYLAQRVQLAGQALQLISSRDIALEDQRQGAYKLELERQGMLNDIAGQQWAADKNSAQGIGGAILGTIGGVVGGIYGGPMGATAGASAGTSLGGGIGGLFSGAGGPTLSAPSRYGGGGGGGSSGRGNW